MANSSAKKLHRANTKRLNILRIAILIPTLIYAARCYLLSTPNPTFHKIVFVVLACIHATAFALIWVSAKPSYSPTGALIDAGDDISSPGMLEYAHDLIYFTIFVQLLLLVTPWALLLYLAIPIYLIFRSCMSAPSSLSAAPEEPQPEHDFGSMSRKERRKAERSARKQTT